MVAAPSGWEALHDVAKRLKSSANASARDLPAMLFFTDPVRTPEPWVIAERLPPGAGVVFRAFGAADAVPTGLRLADICRAQRLVLLAGADAGLAEAIGAGGVHLPERLAGAARALRAVHPDWLLTLAAHGAAGLSAAAAGIDACVLSPVFESSSPSAGAPLGVSRFAALVRACTVPVYALGGVNEKTAPELLGSGAVGLAAVSAGLRT